MIQAKAVVLFSGGLDSSTCLAIAQSKGLDCHALSFDYGQRQRAELRAAQKIAAYFNAKHKIFNLALDQFGHSALTDEGMTVPRHLIRAKEGIPITYVPARNTIFLSIALAWAETLGAEEIFIGVSYVDYSGYPDCRPKYIRAFQKLAHLATKVAVQDKQNMYIRAPILYLSKAETIQVGMKLGVPYAMTVSCYQANQLGHGCGYCDSCVLRKNGFSEAGVSDPTVYFGND